MVSISTRFCFALLFLACSLTQAFAHFDPAQTTGDDEYRDDKGKKLRTLCWTMKDVTDSNWRSWIRQAVDKWNAVSSTTGWTFVECPEDCARPNIRFRLYDELPPAEKGGACGSFQTGIGKDRPEDYQIKIKKDVTKDNVNGTIPSGGYKGWGEKGATTLDPILVMGHELTHAMKLHHTSGGLNKTTLVNMEDPIGVGVHGGSPSAKDQAEAKIGAQDGLAMLPGRPPRPGDETYAVGLHAGGAGLPGAHRRFRGEDIFFGVENVQIDERDFDDDGLHGTAGATFTWFMPVHSCGNQARWIRPFLRTGIFTSLEASRVNFANVSGFPRGTGSAEVRQQLGVPLLFGGSIPATTGPEGSRLWFDAYLGAMVASERIRISLSEAGAPGGLPTQTSSTTTRIYPAIGVGTRYYLGRPEGERPLSIQTDLMATYQGRLSLHAPSANFPSETYFYNRGSGVGLQATIGLAVGF
jgi:hypothetical protein